MAPSKLTVEAAFRRSLEIERQLTAAIENHKIYTEALQSVCPHEWEFSTAVNRPLGAYVCRACKKSSCTRNDDEKIVPA